MDAVILSFFITIYTNLLVSIVTFAKAIYIYLKIPTRPWIFLLYLSTILFWILSVVSLVLLANYGDFMFDIFSQLFLILSFSSYMAFSYAFEGGEGKRKVPTITFFTSAGVIMMIISLIEGEDKFASIINYHGYYFSIWKPFPGFIFSSGLIIAGLWMEIVLRRTLSNIRTEVQEKQIRNMRFGNLIALLVSPLIVSSLGIMAFNIFSRIDIAIILIYSISYLIVSLGLFFVLLAYTIQPTMAYLKPQILDYLLVLRTGGLPIFTFEFRENTTEDPSYGLISGAITAFTALVNEAFSVEDTIDEIKFGSKIILFKLREDYVFLLICENKSSFISNAFNNFTNFFLNRFRGFEFKGKVNHFDKIKGNTEKIFGY